MDFERLNKIRERAREMIDSGFAQAWNDGRDILWLIDQIQPTCKQNDPSMSNDMDMQCPGK